MSPKFTDDEIDEVFNWLEAYVTEVDSRPHVTGAPSLKPEQRELAWQAAQAHQNCLPERSSGSLEGVAGKIGKAVGALGDRVKELLEQFPYCEPINFAFASDGKINEEGLSFDRLLGGDCSLTVECIPDDPDWKIVRVKFSEHRIPEFQGRRMAVGIGGQRYELGEVSRRGIAEAEIPGDLDLAQLEYVDYGKPLDLEI